MSDLDPISLLSEDMAQVRLDSVREDNRKKHAQRASLEASVYRLRRGLEGDRSPRSPRYPDGDDAAEDQFATKSAQFMGIASTDPRPSFDRMSSVATMRAYPFATTANSGDLSEDGGREMEADGDGEYTLDVRQRLRAELQINAQLDTEVEATKALLRDLQLRAAKNDSIIANLTAQSASLMQELVELRAQLSAPPRRHM